MCLIMKGKFMGGKYYIKIRSRTRPPRELMMIKGRRKNYTNYFRYTFHLAERENKSNYQQLHVFISTTLRLSLWGKHLVEKSSLLVQYIFDALFRGELDAAELIWRGEARGSCYASRTPHSNVLPIRSKDGYSSKQTKSEEKKTRNVKRWKKLSK